MKRYDSIIFDFDGTVYDSTGSITASFQYALKTGCGIEETDENRLRSFVGPPLVESFEIYHLSPEKVVQCIDLFRSFYHTTLHMTSLYPGMLDLLEELQKEDVPVAIASTKHQATIETILQRDHILGYFTTVCGPLDDYEPEGKKLLIQRAIESLGKRVGTPCMIGDRFYDAEGARDAGVDFIAAGYGPGTREEFEGFPMVFYADSIGALRDFLH